MLKYTEEQTIYYKINSNININEKIIKYITKRNKREWVRFNNNYNKLEYILLFYL